MKVLSANNVHVLKKQSWTKSKEITLPSVSAYILNVTQVSC